MSKFTPDRLGKQLSSANGDGGNGGVGAFQLGGNTLPARVLAVGMPCRNAREDAGFEQTRPQREMRPPGVAQLTFPQPGIHFHSSPLGDKVRYHSKSAAIKARRPRRLCLNAWNFA